MEGRLLVRHPPTVNVEGPAEFWDWLVELADAASRGDLRALERQDLALALLLDLYDLPFPPDRESETVSTRRVRQVERHPTWRLHARGDRGDVRFLVAFPVGARTALILSSDGNAARIGDLFWRSYVRRTEALVEHWLHDRARGVITTAPGLTRGFESGDEHLAFGLAQWGVGSRVAAVQDRLRAFAVIA